MGLFDSLFGGGQDDFNPLDGTAYKQYASDVDNVRNVANSNITGLDAGGQAASNLASTVYGNQLDQLNQQAGSNLATGQAGVSRYGADAGAYERMGNSNMRNQLMGQQNLGQTNMQNQADILNQNISQQQNMKNTALMGLPQMSQMGFQAETTANAANQQANNAQASGLGSVLGTVAGGAFGGPIGAAAGGSLGGMLGGSLFG